MNLATDTVTLGQSRAGDSCVMVIFEPPAT